MRPETCKEASEAWERGGVAPYGTLAHPGVRRGHVPVLLWASASWEAMDMHQGQAQTAIFTPLPNPRVTAPYPAPRGPPTTWHPSNLPPIHSPSHPSICLEHHPDGKGRNHLLYSSGSPVAPPLLSTISLPGRSFSDLPRLGCTVSGSHTVLLCSTVIIYHQINRMATRQIRRQHPWLVKGRNRTARP